MNPSCCFRGLNADLCPVSASVLTPYLEYSPLWYLRESRARNWNTSFFYYLTWCGLNHCFCHCTAMIWTRVSAAVWHSAFYSCLRFGWIKQNRQLHEQMPLICLKRAIYDKSVQEHSYKPVSVVGFEAARLLWIIVGALKDECTVFQTCVKTITTVLL